MSSANRIFEKRRDGLAARTWIRIKSGASPIRRGAACKTDAYPTDRVCGRLS
jgi:hypothetical protein